MKLKQDGDLDLIKGLYVLCPYIAGEWPQTQYSSSTENEGIMISVHNNRSTMAYGIDAFNAKNPLAWPSFAKREDIEGLPPVVISVNECDPLRDEGIGFYRLLLDSGVSARCREMMGACHGIEILATICPDITRSTANDLATFVASLCRQRRNQATPWRGCYAMTPRRPAGMPGWTAKPGSPVQEAVVR